jgi:hypothetical protein
LREITRQEKCAGEGGGGGQARGVLWREGEEIGLQSPPLEELCRATPWSSIVGCGCRSRSASPQIWTVAPALVPLLHMAVSLPSGRAHTPAHPSRLCSELRHLTAPSPPRCLPPPDGRGRGLSNSVAAMGSEEAPSELHGVRAVSSSMSLLPPAVVRRSSTCSFANLRARRCGERSWSFEREERFEGE